MAGMKTTVLCVGKIKDRWIAEGVQEYAGRLKRFGTFQVVEVADERVPERFSQKELERAMDREGDRLLAKWPKDTVAIALSPAGKALGSEKLAQFIADRRMAGEPHLTFIIGGSNGIPKSVLKKCRHTMSFGPNTFPHQLFRVMLLEQIYRAEKILAGETYHK